MLTGELKDLVSIFAESETTNDFSERVKTYSLSFKVWAEVSYMSGTEKQTGAMSGADRMMKFKVRFHISRFTERQVILWRGDYYNIRAIDPDRDRTYLNLTGERILTGTITIV